MNIKFAGDTPQRLDKFLRENLPAISRASLQKQIKKGLITVNKTQVPAHHFLKKNEVIEIAEKNMAARPPEDNLVPAPWELKIAAQTDDYVIIEKEAGVVTHPSPHTKQGTLAQKIAVAYPEISSVGEDPSRPGLVHRLDKEVSGLLVVARTEEMFARLKEQFKTRTMQKEYTGLVYGKIEKTRELINKPIGRAKGRQGRMAAHTQCYADDKPALTEYHLLDTIKNYSLLKIIIHTGRTHQIRVHLFSIGHPVVGDELYKIKRFKQINLGRLFLHASRLGFRDLSGKYVEYTSPLPEELKNFLKTL